MGAELSKENDLFRPNPKFQKTAPRGHSSANANVQHQVTTPNETSPRTDAAASLTRSERGHGSPSAHAQYEVTGLNETSPKTDAAISFTSSEKNVGLLSTDNQPSCSSNIQEPTHQKINMQINSPNVDKDNLGVIPSPSPNKTFAGNPKSDKIQNSFQINSMRGLETSPKRQSQQVQNENSPSKTVFSNFKFKPPERDVRHVPTFNEQIKLSSSVTGNPFLSSSDNKSEYVQNESVRQVNHLQNFASNEIVKCTVKEKLENMYVSGIISRYDLDEHALNTLDTLPIDLALDILNKFALSNPKTKSNKSAYLMGMIKNRKSVSPNSKITDPTSSQKNSDVYFTNTKNNDLAGTMLNSDKEEKKETNQVSSPVSLLPKELLGDTFSFTKDQCSSGSISIKNTMTTNASYTGISKPLNKDILQNIQAEKVLSYEENVASRCEQSPIEISVQHNFRQNRLAPRFQRNITKNIVLKPHSAKTNIHSKIKVERIAESLDSFNKCSDTNGKMLIKQSISANSSEVDLKTNHQTPSMEECILQMTNIKPQPKETLTLLQQRIWSNLEIINNFILVLKTFPYTSEEIVSQVDKLKENVMSFPVDANCSSLHPNSCASLSPSKISVNKTNHTNPGLNQYKSNIFLNPSSFIVEKTDQAECSNFKTASTPLKSFKVLLDQLPHEYESEKKNISLKEENLFCTICNNSVDCTVSSLINHFESLDHKKYLNIINSLVTPPQLGISKELLFDKSETKESIPEIKLNNKDELTLGNNHEGILELVYKSCEKNLVLDQNFYICIPCDFWTPENDAAMNHVKCDKMHVKQQIQNAKWHTCNTCGIDIYATEKNLHDHYLSVLHSKIVQVKQKSPNDKDLSNTDEKVEDRDDISVCSSKGDPSHEQKKPHEILLLIAKNKKRENFGDPIGLYCHVCRRYFRYDKLKPDANRSVRHIRDHANISGRKYYKVFHCSSCSVDLFGDKVLWQEHESMELHKELAHKFGYTNQFDNMTESNNDHKASIGSQQLSHEEGPHFYLMAAILKNHIKNESGKDVFGYYCHLCQIYTLEEDQWRTHIVSASHSNRINSSDCMNTKMWHNCSVCNINLICNDHIFSQHERSSGHKAVSKLHQSRSDQRGAGLSPLTKIENDEEGSDNESEDTEDESEDEEDNDSQSTTSSKNANSEDTTTIGTGIKVTGLPPDVEQRELFETFKKFGFIKTCNLHRSGRSGTILFRDKRNVNYILEKNDIYIRRKKINVYPLVRRRRGVKRAPELMDASVMEILKSKEKLDKLTNELKTEISEISQQRSDTSTQIVQDIIKAVPGCKVHIFGSQYTGLALRDSDCDIYIDHDCRSYFTELSQRQQETIIQALLNKFTYPKSGFRVCDTVLEARVPILRVVHNRTNIPCDISCRSGLSMENSMLTRQLLYSDFRVKWLVIIIKWWMNANDLLGTNKFTSYTTIWLVLFFLMRVQPCILSSVLDMKEGCPPYQIGYWDCRFSRNFRPSKNFQNPNCDSREKLLIDFFKFYGTFNYKNIVMCPLTANVIPRKHFEELKVPPAYNPYVQKIRTIPDAERLRTATPICLQDPFDLSHNIAKGVSRKDLNKFKKFCCLSYKICENHLGSV